MKTLTEKFNAVNEGRFAKAQFLRDARLAHPTLITQFNSYDDAVTILKNKGMISEVLEKYKEEKTPEYQYEANTEDMFPIEAIERGIDYELEKKGFDVVKFNGTQEDYLKAKEEVVKNLTKDPNFYLNLLAGNHANLDTADEMEEAKPSNTVDKANGMSKVELKENSTTTVQEAQLKEAVKSLIVKILNENEVKVEEKKRFNLEGKIY